MINNINSKSCLKVIQITDTHLFALNDCKIFGINSNFNFNQVVKKIKYSDLRDADFIILTGDLSQDESSESYLRIMYSLSDFSIPVYWIPGNHDHFEKMNDVFSRSSFFNYIKILELKHWVFIFLNTKKDGLDSGYLDSNELFFIEKKINGSDFKNKKIAIIMHHHPVEVGTPLIDNYILENRSQFWSIIQHKKIDLIICGHVHGNYSFIHRDVRIESAPATCFQFKKKASDLEIENLIGYKIHNFNFDSYSMRPVVWEGVKDVFEVDEMDQEC